MPAIHFPAQATKHIVIPRQNSGVETVTYNIPRKPLGRSEPLNRVLFFYFGFAPQPTSENCVPQWFCLGTTIAHTPWKPCFPSAFQRISNNRKIPHAAQRGPAESTTFHLHGRAKTIVFPMISIGHWGDSCGRRGGPSVAFPGTFLPRY